MNLRHVRLICLYIGPLERVALRLSEALSILVDLIPPTQTDQQPAGHVLKHGTNVSNQNYSEVKETVLEFRRGRERTLE
ncbi:hypothetical protein EYF80_001770 [Liparis tanakae]|uniref:Uncharacterized protein n=1 Tax=Liparis tanakae TaxID=230148 RepID=A0A4Z2JC78_9TELE|nr:hypothetical protein EYF80_001770 [Liparis tanakae]